MRALSWTIALLVFQLATATSGLASPVHVVFMGEVSSVDADLFFPFQQIGVEVGDPFSLQFAYDSSIPDLAFPNDPTRATYVDGVLSWRLHVGSWTAGSDQIIGGSEIDITVNQGVNPNDLKISVTGDDASDDPSVLGSVTGFRFSSRGNTFLESDSLPFLQHSTELSAIIRLDRGDDFPVGGLVLRAEMVIPEPTTLALVVTGLVLMAGGPRRSRRPTRRCS